VAEGEPVCAVGEEGIAAGGVGECGGDSDEPSVERGKVLGECKGAGGADEPGGFVDEGKGGDAAEDEAEEEEDDPAADGVEDDSRSHDVLVIW
jgi:hypothetical protein